jgi:hypothetical protein
MVMGNPFVQKQPDMNALYQQFMQNPMQYLTGMNIPKELTTPQQIVQYLADNGKIPPVLQQRVNAMLGRK